jgi:hypothetical protein
MLPCSRVRWGGASAAVTICCARSRSQWRVAPTSFEKTSHRLLGGAARRRAQQRLLEHSAERGQRRPSGVEVAGGERALLRGRRGAESRVLVERGLHDGGEVARGRPLHPGNAHVASERDRPDPVLDPVPADGDERGREADVEGTRLHPDEPRDREVPQLVQEDERREGEDDDEPGHHLPPREEVQRGDGRYFFPAELET